MTNMIDIAPGAESITREELTIATVLAGVVAIFQQNPKYLAMAQNNNRDRFIEGCQNDPEFSRAVTLALAEVRAAAIAA